MVLSTIGSVPDETDLAHETCERATIMGISESRRALDCNPETGLFDQARALTMARFPEFQKRQRGLKLVERVVSMQATAISRRLNQPAVEVLNHPELMDEFPVYAYYLTTLQGIQEEVKQRSQMQPLPWQRRCKR